jgi:hypothetical protein
VNLIIDCEAIICAPVFELEWRLQQFERTPPFRS